MQSSFLDVFLHEGKVCQHFGAGEAAALPLPDSPDWVRAVSVAHLTQAQSLTHLGRMQAAVLQGVCFLLAKSPAHPGPVALSWGPKRGQVCMHLGQDFPTDIGAWLHGGTDGEVRMKMDHASGRTFWESVQGQMARYIQELGDAMGPTPAQAAAWRRQDLARQWLTARQVSSMMGSRAHNASQFATQRRLAGQVLGAWVPSERAYRYPPWQFQESGQPVEHLEKILRLLRKQGRMATRNKRTSGWTEIEWFHTPHALLEGDSPAHVLAADPGRVLAAAEGQFVEDSDAGGV